MKDEFKPRPMLTPENLISEIAYGTLSENNINEEELHAVAYYLEELCWSRWQLAEKDKLINDYADDLEKVANENADLVFKLAEKDDALETHKRAIQRMNRNCDTTMCRNKISFAVEQLERLKHDIWTDQQDDGWLDEKVDIYFLTETIDNQIKGLIHQHKDKGE